MSDEIAELRKEFTSLVSEGKAFFKEVRRDVITNDITTVGIGFEWSWEMLPDEQRSRATDIRHRLRCLLARLATPFQGSPLLDKQDFRKFVRLGRAMDAAMRLQAFRSVCIRHSEDYLSASVVFDEASERLGELLDLIPEQDSHSAAVEARPASTEQHGIDHEVASSSALPAPPER